MEKNKRQNAPDIGEIEFCSCGNPSGEGLCQLQSDEELTYRCADCGKQVRCLRQDLDSNEDSKMPEVFTLEDLKSAFNAGRLRDISSFNEEQWEWYFETFESWFGS